MLNTELLAGQDDPAGPAELRRAITSMAAMLEAREWAEHVSSDDDVLDLEGQVTALVGEHGAMHDALTRIAELGGDAGAVAAETLRGLDTLGGDSIDRVDVAAPAAAPLKRLPLTDAQIEAGREAVFSVNNPFCPCDSKTMRKAVRWAERAHGIVAEAG